MQSFEDIRTCGETRIIYPGEAGGRVHGNSTVALLDKTAATVEIISL
ncbi:MAG: hypothetical protein MUP70_05350 [Candidatus Aminicenantes bacterium]|nr:hypothetical protein [Candidatus Aminicenantes bacterium]